MIGICVLGLGTLLLPGRHASASQKIDWKECTLNGTRQGLQEGNYLLGAFFHYGHPSGLSIRTRDFPENGKVYKESVGIVIVPYIQDKTTKERYILVPASDKNKKDTYIFVCPGDSLERMTNHPSSYLTVLLTPTSSLKGDQKERQSDLFIFLTERNSLEKGKFFDTLIPISIFPQDDFATVKGERVSTLTELVQKIMSEKRIYFLRDWDSPVHVDVKNENGKSRG